MRGHYGSPRVGTLPGRAAFFDPHAFDKQPDVAISHQGVIILCVCAAAIVGIGVVGTKLGVKWS